MNFKPRNLVLATLLWTGAPITATTAQDVQAPAAGTTLETCLKAVNLLGASMGYSEVTDGQGHPLYRFRLRTSGMDYMATCDAKSGIVGDISARRPDDTAPL